MPTYETTQRFLRDLQGLSPQEREAFDRAIGKFIEDLRRGQFRAGLRVKGVRGWDGVYEMTWADDGRATFEYGPEQNPGDPHIIWRRVGTHDIFRRP